MGKYIDREALIKKLSHISITITGGRLCGKTLYAKALKGFAEAVIKAIREAPAADVVEVVRCKKCKHYNTVDKICMKLSVEPDAYGNGAYISMNEDDFCSHGERKDDIK